MRKNELVKEYHVTFSYKTKRSKGNGWKCIDSMQQLFAWFHSLESEYGVGNVMIDNVIEVYR